MLELTISFETLVADSRQRKQSKYQDSVEGGKAGGYSTHLLTLEVGSRGMVDVNDFYSLAQALRDSKKDVFSLSMLIGHSDYPPRVLQDLGF